jgi:hypothetical protein
VHELKKQGKRIPTIGLVALLVLVIFSGLALADVLVTRTGHITRPVSVAPPTIFPEDGANFGFEADQATGQITYSVTNPGLKAYTAVTVTAESLTPGMTISPDQSGFPLASGETTVVTMTITFTDPLLESGSYSVSFEAV